MNFRIRIYLLAKAAKVLESLQKTTFITIEKIFTELVMDRGWIDFLREEILCSADAAPKNIAFK